MLNNILIFAALLFTFSTPSAAMMRSDVIPCPPAAPVVDEGEKLARRAKDLYGDQTRIIYFNESVLGMYLEVAKSGDQEKIEEAHKELDEEAKQRPIRHIFKWREW